MLPRMLRDHGYDPTLFGYSDTTLDPATLAADDPRRTSYEQPMPGFSSGLLLDDDIGPWIDWLAEQGYDVPEDAPRHLRARRRARSPTGRGATWRPAVYAAEHTESAFMTTTALDWLDEPGRTDEPWCAHLSYLRPHPPYLAPAPYNDMFDPADVPGPGPPARPPRTRRRCTRSWRARSPSCRRPRTTWTSASCARPTTA